MTKILKLLVLGKVVVVGGLNDHSMCHAWPDHFNFKIGKKLTFHISTFVTLIVFCV